MHEEQNSIKHILLLIGLLLSFLLIIFFYYVFKYHKKSIKLYSEKLSAEMSGRELERKRISKDLHDELGSTLTGANMYLQVLNGDVDHDKQVISKVQSSVSRSLEQIKQIMNDLYPVSLDNYGLVACLNEFIEEINQLNAINIIFTNTVENIEAKILKEHKIHIFRIIKEISQNTIKHADSSVLSLRFSQNDNKIILETIDQGKGFDGDDKAYTNKGRGLNNIISRVELISGEIYLDTRPQKGVHYTIEIPILYAHSQN
jgi:signal transduction histidine kinase